ncbi:MAG: hypothetical protein GEU28_07800 [Dehalococcoidia bacterium]|nr:hypothetical protein [Dehalococcoidia bacterium]
MEPTREAQLIGRRSLGSGDPGLLQMVFSSEVLAQYRGRPGFSIIRSNSAGRLRQEGGWSLDFGVSGGDSLVHASWRDLTTRLPAVEREAWAAWAVSHELSGGFVQMQLNPGSCFDDGDIRPW